MRAAAFVAAALCSALFLCAQPASAQVGGCISRVLAILCSVPTEPAAYDQLPAWHQLSAYQQNLVGQWKQCSQTSPSVSLSDCWTSLTPELRATFFMITYVLEKSTVGARPMMEHVSAIEGVLVPGRAIHHHDLPNVTAEVDGWRVHITIQGFGAGDLRQERWKEDAGTAVETHSRFGYTVSFRDYRESDRYEGPFLQLVLNAAENSSDSDLDVGRICHFSSPQAIYGRFIRRFDETERKLKIR